MSAKPASRWILAIECSNPSVEPVGCGRPASVCVAHPIPPPNDLCVHRGEDIASTASPSGRGGHDDDLLPAVDRACRAADLSPGDLAMIAVSLGPGGYTSLRLAVAAAKMIATATGTRLVGVPTALIAARTSHVRRPAPTSILVALASKNDAASLTLIRNSDRGMRKPLSIVSSGVCTADHVPAPLAPTTPDEPPPCLIADQFLPPAIAAAAERLGYQRIPLALRAAECAASAVLDNLPFSDPRTLAPIYAREPDAVTLWRARHPGPPG